MPKFLIDLTMCFSKGQTVFHGGGEYGKDAARFLAENLQGYEVVALIRSETRAAVEAELGNGVPLREVGPGPMRHLPGDLDVVDNILFLPLPGKFLKGQGGGAAPRIIAVEHDLRAFDMAHGISDHLCHPLLTGTLAKLVCAYAALRRRKRVRWAMAKTRPRFVALREGDRVVTPSRYTQYAIHLNLPHILPHKPHQLRDRVSLLPPLSPFHRDEFPGGAENRQGLLLLGTNRLVKNAERFLEGLSRHPVAREAANREGVDLVGATGAVRTRLERRFGRALTLRFHPYVEAGRLQELIASAKVLVFPSLAEGYGIPPVEAFKWGTPVLASAATSIPEVVAGAAVLADPLEGSEMANKALQLLAEPELWQFQAAQGRQRYEVLRDEAHQLWADFARGLEVGTETDPMGQGG